MADIIMVVNKTQLGLTDLDETVPPFKEGGFKALKPSLHLSPISSTEGHVPAQHGA